MIDSAAAIGMTLTALGMVLAPGPNMMYLVSRSISQGRRAGMTSLGGTVTGFLVYLALTSLGLIAVLTVVPWLFIGVKVAGAGYLAFLAWQALRPGGHGVFEPRSLHRDGYPALFRMGLLTNLLNPKAAVMYAALIPQFIDPARGSVAVQGLVLGGIQIAVSATVNTAIVLAAGAIAAFLARRPSWAVWQRRATGALLGLVAVILAREIPQGVRP